MAKCIFGPMYLVIDGVTYGVVERYSVQEGGLIITTNPTVTPGSKTRTGEYQLFRLTGGSLNACERLPENRCGITVILVMAANQNSDDPDTLRSITLTDADINGVSTLDSTTGSYTGLEIVACNATYNYGQAG